MPASLAARNYAALTRSSSSRLRVGTSLGKLLSCHVVSPHWHAACRQPPAAPAAGVGCVMHGIIPEKHGPCGAEFYPGQ